MILCFRFQVIVDDPTGVFPNSGSGLFLISWTEQHAAGVLASVGHRLAQNVHTIVT